MWYTFSLFLHRNFFCLYVPTQNSVNAQISAGIVIFKEFTTGFPTLLWCGQVLGKSQLVHQYTLLSGKWMTKVLDLIPTRCPQQLAFREPEEGEKNFLFKPFTSKAVLKEVLSIPFSSCWSCRIQHHFREAEIYHKALTVSQAFLEKSIKAQMGTCTSIY